MSTILFREWTTATPEEFIAALTDFGPGGCRLFHNGADDCLQVHDRGADWADVTEGSRRTWERVRYDWSLPRRITMVTIDSNIWGRGTARVCNVTPREDGVNRLIVTVAREGRNLRGHLAGLLLGVIGKPMLRKSLRKTIAAVEARSTASGT